ncbi:FAD-dependent oxidoreductase [Methyloterricola oryzae]|uniref:FAD-dependent oxidoreductase n=1 Tax=Methyloterricola oryzae TaxID=1495050 RepID=UPI0005EACDE1|nr:NAD(P)/FAD-dependent oxidoreductase [Methyloterricola oryzae]
MSTYEMDVTTVDILIAGGGVGGSAAAAALSELGLEILIVEPDPEHGRKLAGELIHPPGVDGLCALGLMDADALDGCKVEGFAVFPFSDQDGEAPMRLPYGTVRGRERAGLAIEHHVLKRQLLDKAQRMPGVSLWSGARVDELCLQADGTYAALVSGNDKQTRIQARLIIGADGPMSQLRKMAGIAFETQRYSGMMGLEVDATHLPHPGYGNIFLNSAGVSYAYAIAPDRVRVMFEILRGSNYRESIREHLSRFPADFRADIEAELAKEKPLATANYCIIPESSIKGNLALMGDARGCCHPLTASGITAAVKDATILRDALRDSGFDYAAALRRYAVVCGRLQLTRRTLAEELREAFLAQTPESSLLSQCIFSYWRNSPRGRSNSMALLSTLDSSIYSLAREYALVALHAFKLLPRWSRNRAMAAWHRGVFKLLCKSVAFQHAAVSLRVKELLAYAR